MRMIANEKGFTLMETLVAVMVFVIGAAALTNMLLTTIKGNSLGRQETVAVMIAHDKLEELRSIEPSAFYTDVRLSAGAHTLGNVSSLRTAFSGAQFTASYVVSDVTTNGSLFYQNLKQVDVTVSWMRPSPHSVTIGSILVPNI